MLKQVTFTFICAVLCGITVFASSGVPFNPFDPVDTPPPITTEPTTATESTTQSTTSATTESPPTTTALPTTTTAPIPALIPDNVQETYENGVKKIVKTYELSEKDNTDHISKEGFESNGWDYTFADITKRETVDTKTREYTQTINLTPATENVNTIIDTLDKSMIYTSDDGYSGTLILVESSVKAVVSGTKVVPFTISEKRTYDNLSLNDSSYIPKSISDKYGRVLTLNNLTWRTNSAVYIDGDELPDSYTGVATYTGTGYKTVVTGYTGNAEYTGTISKSTTGKTIYTVIFTGTEIPPPTTTELPTTTEPPTTTAEPTTEPIIVEEPEPFNPVPIVATSTGSVGLLGGLVFLIFFRKNTKVYNKINGAFAQISKVRVSYKMPIINLTPLSEKAQSGEFLLEIDHFAAKLLDDKTVVINYGDKRLEHIVNRKGFTPYEFQVKF